VFSKGNEVSKAVDREEMLQINQEAWNHVAPRFYGVTALPTYGPLTPTEDELHLLGEVQGKRILEIGCGSGHSLTYAAARGAGELWGLDISTTQIEAAKRLHQEQGLTSHLFCSPMEENPGVPEGYFDLIFSIYALGWTVDLAQTLSLIASYLAPGGRFLFSWEHPMYRCLRYRDGHFVLERSYNDEVSYISPRWADGKPTAFHPRKISTYVNAIIDAGLLIERLVEAIASPAQATATETSPEQWYSLPRAQLVPTTMILKARKPNAFGGEIPGR
jgi:SAM-dependent methyltransferase